MLLCKCQLRFEDMQLPSIDPKRINGQHLAVQVEQPVSGMLTNMEMGG